MLDDVILYIYFWHKNFSKNLIQENYTFYKNFTFQIIRVCWHNQSIIDWTLKNNSVVLNWFCFLILIMNFECSFIFDTFSQHINKIDKPNVNAFAISSKTMVIFSNVFDLSFYFDYYLFIWHTGKFSEIFAFSLIIFFHYKYNTWLNYLLLAYFACIESECKVLCGCCQQVSVHNWYQFH